MLSREARPPPHFSSLIDELVSTSFHQIIGSFFQTASPEADFRGDEAQMQFPVGRPLFINLFILNNLRREPDGAQPADPQPSPGPGRPPPSLTGFCSPSPFLVPRPGRRAELILQGRCSRTPRVRRSQPGPGTPRATQLLRARCCWRARLGSPSGSGGRSAWRELSGYFKRRVGGGLREVGLIFPAFILLGMNELNFRVRYEKGRRILCVDKPCHPLPLRDPHIQCRDDE